MNNLINITATIFIVVSLLLFFEDNSTTIQVTPTLPPPTVQAEEIEVEPEATCLEDIVPECEEMELEEYMTLWYTATNPTSYSESYNVINENYGTDYVSKLNMNCSVNGCYDVDDNNDGKYLMSNGYYCVILPAELKPQYPGGSKLRIEFTNEYNTSVMVDCIVIDYRSASHGNTIGFNQSDSPYMYDGQWTARIVYQ